MTKAPSNQGQWQCLYPFSNAIKSGNAKTDTVKTTILTDSQLSLDNRGLAYGDGFFTTMGVIDGLILWQDYHIQRLKKHAQALQLAIDDQSQLASIIMSLQAQAEQLQQGIMKLIVTRAHQTVRGYGFRPTVSGSVCDIWLKSTAMSIDTGQYADLPNTHSVLMQPVSNAVCLTSRLACLPEPLVGLKTLNCLDSVLASSELQRINAALPAISFSEGLLRDMTGSWVEGTMSNVFYQLASSQADNTSFANSVSPTSNYLLSGQWYTPPLTQSGVQGVMRQVIIDALTNTDAPAIMRPLQDDDLPNIKALCFCNAVRGIVPISTFTLPKDQVIRF